jgi:hypothetical protein
MIPTVLVTITQVGNLITTFGPIAVGIALQIRKLFQGSGSAQPFEVQIQTLRNGILVTVDDEDKLIADWLKAHPEHA